MPVMIEREGYEKKVDLVSYFIKIPEKLPDVYEKAYTRITRNNQFRIVEFKSKKEIKKYILPILELLNQTFIEIYGFVPLDDNEKIDLAKRYLMIIDPKFVKVVESEGILVGFAVGIPDISPGIKAAKGKCSHSVSLRFFRLQNVQNFMMLWHKERVQNRDRCIYGSQDHRIVYNK